jgi:glycerate kinase
MNVLIAVDKFKGSLTTFEASSIIKSAIHKVKPNYNVISFPMADGGDGFSKVLKYYLNTKTVSLNTVDPLHRKIKGHYEWDVESKTAIIELAVASGIVLLKKHELDPLSTSTFGTGLLIKHAIKKGAKKIILGLGGSATNDGGMGIACALGYKFKDASGNELKPCGASLNLIKTIQAPSSLFKVAITIACDVTNPLYGKNGAAYIYAPQKGANPQQVKVLDDGLRNLSKVLSKETGIKIATIPGVGAAGGVSAFLNSYQKVEMVNGIDLILKYSGIKKWIKKANLLITGEGKIDNQSLNGKVVGSLVELARAYKSKVLLVAGIVDLSKHAILKKHDFIQLVEQKIDLSKSMSKAHQILLNKTVNYFQK